MGLTKLFQNRLERLRHRHCPLKLHAMRTGRLWISLGEFGEYKNIQLFLELTEFTNFDIARDTFVGMMKNKR